MLGGMNRIKLHQTSPEFSALAFGTWRLLDDPLTATPGALLELLKVCLDCGITTIDTAEIYGGYRVEELVGAALALDPGVKARRGEAPDRLVAPREAPGPRSPAACR